jgi:hypothetical protein
MMNETSEKDRVRYRGRYYAEYVRVASGTDHQRAVQEALDSGSENSWHLVGVEGESRSARQSFSGTPNLQTLVGRTGLGKHVQDPCTVPNDARDVSNP